MRDDPTLDSGLERTFSGGKERPIMTYISILIEANYLPAILVETLLERVLAEGLVRAAGGTPKP